MIDDISPNHPAVILFHANWCGHCQHMKPEWDKLAANPKFNSIMDCIDIEYDDLPSARQHPYIGKAAESVVSFPTIMFYVKNSFIPYEGERSFAAMSAEVQKWGALIKPTPVKSSPKKEPVKKESVKKEPVKKEPVKKEPVKKEPVKKESVKKEPVKKVPAKKVPAKKKLAMKGGSCGCAGMASPPPTQTGGFIAGGVRF